MSEETAWWEALTEEEIAAELAEEARQGRLAEEVYRELMRMPDADVSRTDEF